MPAETKSAPAGPSSLEGATFTPQSAEELHEAIEKAFDYRGNVTLTLTNDETVEGYLANRDVTAKPPRVEMYPAKEEGMRVIPYADIRGVAFTGKDPADGKSWQAWVAKKDSDRKAEAERLEAESRARGEL